MEYLFKLSRADLESIAKDNEEQNQANTTAASKRNIATEPNNDNNRNRTSEFEKYRYSVADSIIDVSAFYTDKDGNNLDSLKNEIYNAKTFAELDRLYKICEKFRMDFYRESMQ